MYTTDILSHFPLPKIRAGQKAVILETDKVIKAGKKLVIIEGPVGCGKSAIAMTFAKAFESSHLITPRKSLQNQYFDDFSADVVLMKGRSAYPCTMGVTKTKYIRIANAVKNGQVKQPGLGESNCGTAPCRNSPSIYKACVENTGLCPYTLAMETAQAHHSVIHNIHSFIFQTAFSEKFEKRKLLVIDEAHEIEGVIREFTSKKFVINKEVPLDTVPGGTDIDVWCNFFLTPAFIPVLSNGEKQQKEAQPDWIAPDEEYITKVEYLRLQKDFYKNKFTVKTTHNIVGTRVVSTSFEFIADSLGSSATDYLFSMGEYVILMSGTIYGKDFYCRNLGINPNDAHYIRISSEFPVGNRPIYAKPEYQVDTSYAMWDVNFKEMIEKMTKIMNIFGDAKGLIHAPSYEAAEQIVHALPGVRAVTHGKHDFQEKLQMFYDSDQPLVFVSPVCQQGVDFKGDRARFQIITRVPYLNTSDEFVKYKVENDFAWYNYQALVVFGQQLGRVNRSPDDYGATFLMDSRFNKFIVRNMKLIPKWVLNAITWK